MAAILQKGEGASQLAAAPGDERVEVLVRSKRLLPGAGAQALVAPFSKLQALRKVSLGWNGLSASMVQRLQQAGLEVDLTG